MAGFLLLTAIPALLVMLARALLAAAKNGVPPQEFSLINGAPSDTSCYWKHSLLTAGTGNRGHLHWLWQVLSRAV